MVSNPLEMSKNSEQKLMRSINFGQKLTDRKKNTERAIITRNWIGWRDWTNNLLLAISNASMQLSDPLIEMIFSSVLINSSPQKFETFNLWG